MNARACLIAGLACLLAAHLIASRVLAPARADLVPTADIHDALTPGEFAGTLMLGGFRGLATDLLWMRAVNAKDAGRFYESLALCEAISRVQPRFEQVWEFMSWDLAYNIGHEVEDQDGKWAWFRAGLGFNIRGCARNPGSERLLRHLAWLFFHKGDWFQRRIEACDFAPELEPLLREVERRAGQRAEAAMQHAVAALRSKDPAALAVAADGLRALRPLQLPPGGGLTTYAISAVLYQATIVLAEAEGVHLPPFVRRMVPQAIHRDGNLWRNRGDHRQALTRWLDALEAWRDVVAWNRSPATDADDQRDHEISRAVTERNCGYLRRQAAFLARRLAEEPALGERAATAIERDDLVAARAALAEPGWRLTANRGGVRWLDETVDASASP